MSSGMRWDPCVIHRGQDADRFFSQYFSLIDRKVLIIAGAGFDPRATAFCARIGILKAEQLEVILIREQRSTPSLELLSRAEANIAYLRTLVPHVNVHPIEIFGLDAAVIGGRSVLNLIDAHPIEDCSDVVIDISAMSIGVSFPLIKYMVKRVETVGRPNLHVVVVQDAALDESITPIPGDTVTLIHGFKGGWNLDGVADAARLWLPQLARGRRNILQKIHRFVDPHDTCPILPFPSTRPRLADELAVHYIEELESAWSVDVRDIIYAAEDDPLDLYRTVVRIDDRRRQAFEGLKGSRLILSPTGSKVLALGALLTAMERDLPVAYLESIGYHHEGGTMVTDVAAQANFLHLWLEGDVYSGPRAPLKGNFEA